MSNQTKLDHYIIRKKQINPNPPKPTDSNGVRPPAGPPKPSHHTNGSSSLHQQQKLYQEIPAKQIKSPICRPYFLILPFHDCRTQADIITEAQMIFDPKIKKQICTKVGDFVEKRIKEATKKLKIDVNRLRDFLSPSSLGMGNSTLLTKMLQIAQKPIQLVRLLPSDGTSDRVIITRGQALYLLTHMFLCTSPQQIHNNQITDFRYYYREGSPSRAAKLMCVGQYFKQLLLRNDDQSELDKIITYQRVYNTDKSYLKKCMPMCQVSFTQVPIQAHKGQLMVDFANKLLGGGVLNNGCVQQEILMVTHPQLLIARLICDPLNDYQCVRVHGFKQYSTYEGYSDTFRFKEPFTDVYDTNSVIMIDAENYAQKLQRNRNYQSSGSSVQRELHKAYIGFNTGDSDTRRIVTGKWGCGAFKGDVQLKFVIQWLACSWAGKDEMVFVNWEPEKGHSDVVFEMVVDRLKEKDTLTVRKMLNKYNKLKADQKIPGLGLFTYILDFYNDDEDSN